MDPENKFLTSKKSFCISEDEFMSQKTMWCLRMQFYIPGDYIGF